MNTKALGALFAAPIIAFSGAALAHDGLPPMNAISFDPNLCQIYFPGDPNDPDGGGAVQGSKGRVMVKFDFTHTFTVQANCTVTEFNGVFGGLPDEEGFDCFVQLTKFGNDEFHWHQFLYGYESENKLRFKNGKATMSCKGPYRPGQCLDYDPDPEFDDDLCN